MARKLIASFLLIGLAALPVLSACPGVHHTRTDDGTWITHSFRDVSTTSIAVAVTIHVSGIGSGTTVEYHHRGVWSRLSASSSIVGDGVRLTSGGSADLSYELGTCIDIIEPIDE